MNEKKETKVNKEIIKRGKVHLECKLTQGEIHEAGKRLAEALRNKSMVESRVEAFKQQAKAELTQIEGQIERQQNLVSSEKEFRLIDVEMRYDFVSGLKTQVRMDTGEVVGIERITEDERQMEFESVAA